MLAMKIKQIVWFILTINLLLSVRLSAEVITDGTLGGVAMNLPGPDYQVEAKLGQQFGGNLFHSFSDFNLNQGEKATFSGPNTVSNVISRVTGGNRSHIDGMIRSTIPKADFYFLNPAGIFFGEKATLDINGSFHASTADYLKLGEAGRFAATHPDNSLLTVAPPSAFGFLGQSHAAITVQDSKLQLSENNRLSLTGGDLFIINGQLHAPSGGITLNSMAGMGEININSNQINPPHFQGGEINLSQNAQIITNTNNTANAGDIFIRAGKFVIQDEVSISSDTKSDAQAGKITIVADRMMMTGKNTGNGTFISSKSHKGGDGGIINISATEAIDIRGRSLINASAYKTPQNAGQVIIQTNDLQLADDATIDVRTRSTQGSGNGGEILIKAKTLTMTEETWMIGDTANQGQGGKIDIDADRVYLSDSSAIASVTSGEGPGGDISLNAGSLFLFGEATITTDSTATGTAGNIALHVNHPFVTDSAKITSDTLGNNAYVRKRQGQANLAIRLGAKPNGDFTGGGGHAGTVCFSQQGEECDNNSLIAILAKRLPEKQDIENCPGNNQNDLLLVLKPRIGLLDSPDDLR